VTNTTVSKTTVSNAAVSRQLVKIEQRWRGAKPSLCILGPNGEELLDWSLTSLPSPLLDVTKLFTLAMVAREFDRGALSPDTTLSEALSPGAFEGLCVYKGIDLSSTVTIKDLIAHQSGIPDFFRAGVKGTISLETQCLAHDRSWTLEQAVELARHYPVRHKPGDKRKISYSATNYLLLGEILQQSTGMTFEQLIKLRVSGPLDLKNLFVFTPAHYETYFSISAVRTGKDILSTPQALASFGATGSIVARAKDAARFMQAFWRGQLFDSSWIKWFQDNQRRLLPGVSMGRGLIRTYPPSTRSALFGHSGSSGIALLVDSETNTTGCIALNTAGEAAVAVKILSSVMQSVR
jgi:CubicO group peptidase (beta-lactamase class C family)